MRIRKLKSNRVLPTSTSPKRENLLYKLRYKEVKTPFEKEFMSAISLGYKNKVRKYIDGNYATFTLQDYKGDTPLHLAAKMSDRDLLHMLCLKYPASSRNRNKNNITPLHTAAKRGNLLAIKYFIEEAMVDVTSTDVFGASAAFYAAREGQFECLKYLISARVNIRNTILPDGNNIVHEAAKHGDLEMLKYLCEKCRIKPQYCNANGQHAMHIATMKGNVEAVTYFHKKFDMDPFDPDVDGASSVTISVQYSQSFHVFLYFLKVIPIDFLFNGDPSVSRTLKNPPLTALKAAILYNNKSASNLLIQTMRNRERLGLLWVLKKHQLLQRLHEDKSIQIKITQFL